MQSAVEQNSTNSNRAFGCKGHGRSNNPPAALLPHLHDSYLYITSHFIAPRTPCIIYRKMDFVKFSKKQLFARFYYLICGSLVNGHQKLIVHYIFGAA